MTTVRMPSVSRLRQGRNKRPSLEKEKQEVQEKLSKASAQDSEAKEKLIEVQSRIAEHTAEIEGRKQEIMDILGNRASTKAKIQHYDTTREQIASRRAALSRSILEVSAEQERQSAALEKYEEELSSVQKTIAGYNQKITENEPYDRKTPERAE